MDARTRIQNFGAWRRFYLLILGLLFTVLLLSGCGGRYGAIKRDAVARGVFESYQVLPDHRYYYTGTDFKPEAIIGIQRDYTLKSDFWKPVALTPGMLKHWMSNISPVGRPLSNYGSVILDPNGKQVGIWFSHHDRTTVVFTGDKTLQIYLPTGDAGRHLRRFSDR